MTGINRSRHRVLKEYVEELTARSEWASESLSLKSELALLDDLFESYCSAITGLSELVHRYEHLQKQVRVHARTLHERSRKKSVLKSRK